MIDLKRRIQASIRDEQARQWYRIENRATERAATIYLYDEIGFWGVTAGQFVNEVKALDVDQIDLHVNSPGGDVYDGIAILNALRQHDARVVATVDGLAASAASFIVMAADDVRMAPNSELMVHDAWGLCIGNAADMKALGDRLDKMSDNIASIYATKAGGAVTVWRDAMRAETWYSAQEAVDAGLADSVVDAPVEDAAGDLAARFDLSIFNHAGRRHAPEPIIPKTVAASHSKPPASPVDHQIRKTEGADDMSELITGLRALLGEESAELDEAAILAAVTERIAATNGSGEQPEPQHGPLRPGVQMVDSSVLDQMRQQAEAGEKALARLLKQERDTVISDAIEQGKFAPARRQHWESLYDADPEGTKATIEGLTRNLIPLKARGHAGHESDADELAYRELYPEGM